MSGDSDGLIGATVGGRYRVRERIGAGAMGAVYRADQVGLSRQVALKVLRQEAAWEHATVARFRREARAMSALAHPNTVRVFDFGSSEGGLLYLAMELLDGELASERLQRGPIAPADAIEWITQLLESIGEAHAKKIIHRDLKPDNLFLARVPGNERPIVKVLDFGIAKAIEGDRTIDQFETLDGTVFGTPRYMSPEQAAGKPLDHRCDLYAVGIILYEFLTGAPPFVDKDAVVVMAKHIRERPAPLRVAAPTLRLPASLQLVLDRALHKSPELRFQSTEEFSRALALSARELSQLDTAQSRARALLHRVARAPAKVWAAAGGGVALLALVFLVVLGGGTAGTTGASDADGRALALAEAPEPASAPPASAHVLLVTRPAGATVWQDGRMIGTTPLELEVEGDATRRVELRKDGFTSQTVEFGADETSRTVELSPVTPAAPVGTSSSGPPTEPHPAKAKSGKPKAQPTQQTSSPYEKFR